MVNALAAHASPRAEGATLTTAVLSRLEPVRLAPVGVPQRTLGWEALARTAEFLRQPDGDDAGQPWDYINE